MCENRSILISANMSLKIDGHHLLLFNNNHSHCRHFYKIHGVFQYIAMCSNVFLLKYVMYSCMGKDFIHGNPSLRSSINSMCLDDKWEKPHIFLPLVQTNILAHIYILPST